MPDVREKLVELLRSVPRREEVSIGRGCGKSFVRLGIIADHLIANGVTFAEDTNVPTNSVTRQRWIPVKIEPPGYDLFNATMRFPDGERVSGVAIYKEDGSWTPEYEGAEVTHWMNFPEPSKGE